MVTSKFYTKPDIEITEELMVSFGLLPLGESVKKLASYYKVSIGEAAEIYALLLLPAKTV